VVLVLATENRHKAEEIRSILKGGIQLELRTLADFPGVKLPPETGATYRENAVQKARAAADATGHWAMGDDSGLEVAALGGAPGLYSARFAGEGVTYADNRKKLLDALGDLPDEKRGAAFVCTIAISSPKGEIDVVKGVCEGSITRSEAGGGGFGYDPIFFIPAYRKTFAELPAA
jgi:XTP/dITP diphosphohydrolase